MACLPSHVYSTMTEQKDKWQLFDMRMCLNQESRPDRWKQATEEFKRVGLTDVQQYFSIPADQPNKSFCLSQYAMLKTFYETKEKVGLFFEDDVIFKDLSHLDAAIAQLPEDWDILYLGANITEGVFGIKELPPVKYSPYLYRVRKAWTTHAIAYSRRIVDIILRHYPVGSFEMFDNWLNTDILSHYNCFLVNPMVCWQRPGRSDLWNTNADYTGAFEWGNKFMQQW